MNHYVYRITHTPSNIHYYGARSTKLNPKEDLGIKYFSSSSDKIFKELQKRTPEHFKYKVIKVFTEREHAIKLEIALHDKFDVGVNSSFFNKVKQTSSGFDCSGIKKTPEHIEKIRQSKMNKPKKPKPPKPEIPKNTTIVFDKEGIEKFRCYGNFRKFCEEHGLPYSALRKSRQISEPIFMSKKGQTRAGKQGYENYFGWSARYE